MKREVLARAGVALGTVIGGVGGHAVAEATYPSAEAIEANDQTQRLAEVALSNMASPASCENGVLRILLSDAEDLPTDEQNLSYKLDISCPTEQDGEHVELAQSAVKEFRTIVDAEEFKDGLPKEPRMLVEVGATLVGAMAGFFGSMLVLNPAGVKPGDNTPNNTPPRGPRSPELRMRPHPPKSGPPRSGPPRGRGPSGGVRKAA